MNVNIASSIRYGYLKEYLKKAKCVENFIHDAWPHVSKLLDVNSDMDILIRPMKRLNGTFRFPDNIIHLNVRNSTPFIFRTFMHEMVHAEQFNQGRLLCVARERVLWEGNEMKTVLEGKGYDDLPWEIEAYSRQEELFSSFYKSLIKEGKDFNAYTKH